VSIKDVTLSRCIIMWRDIMARSTTWVMAILASAALGTTAINVLHAQNKSPGAYVIVDISEITS
jgi:hypothetical protein